MLYTKKDGEVSQLIEKRVEKLGYTLPEGPFPTYPFATVLVHDGMAYVSGTLPYVDGKLPKTGQCGKDVTVEEGKQLAEICVLNALASLKKELGTLDRIEQFVKVTGFISSADDFTEQGAVLNGATELLIDIFGDKGKHARSAVGTPVMPGGTPVEVEMIVAVCS